MPPMSFHTQRAASVVFDPADIVPWDHGTGDPVVAGVVRTLLERVMSAGAAVIPSERTGFTVPFDPEGFKQVALELLDEAGVAFLFHALATDVVGTGPDAVGFATKSGPLVIAARMIVDCTGDGDVASLAGFPYEVGRDLDHLVQPMTLMFRMAEFEATGFADYVRAHPDQWHGVHGLWDLVAQATAAGDLDLPREDILFFGTPHAHEVSVNSTRVAGRSGSVSGISRRPSGRAGDRCARLSSSCGDASRGSSTRTPSRAASPSACGRRGESSGSTSSRPTTSWRPGSSTT
jgi:hypothetical protein